MLAYRCDLKPLSATHFIAKETKAQERQIRVRAVQLAGH